MNTFLARAAVIATALLTLTACGNDAGTASGDHDMSTMSSSPSSDDSSADSASDFNDADVAFAQGMIPHHEQAVEMAMMASDRASNPQVKQLASKIQAAQEPEIERLTTWLRAWGEEVPSGAMGGDMSGMDQGSGGMTGMMSAGDMAKLEKASGAAFDRMFLQMMVEHHTGAVKMAQTEVANGENADAKAMAEEIITTQRAEIDEMKQLQQR